MLLVRSFFLQIFFSLSYYRIYSASSLILVVLCMHVQGVKNVEVLSLVLVVLCMHVQGVKNVEVLSLVLVVLCMHVQGVKNVEVLSLILVVLCMHAQGVKNVEVLSLILVVLCAGYYSVLLKSHRIFAELTVAGVFTGVHRYTYTANSASQNFLLFDISHSVQKVRQCSIFKGLYEWALILNSLINFNFM